jgi:hypothetical protein
MATVLRAVAAVVLLALVLAVAGCGGSESGGGARGAERPAAAVDPFLGIVANTLGYGGAVGRAQDVVRRAGVRYLREELSWYVIEPKRGARRWATTDRLMVAAAHRRMQMLVLLTGTPRWAARPNGGLPTRTAAYAAYVRDVVARYGPHGSFWRRHPTLPHSSAPVWFELWNEPYYAPPVRAPLDATRYAALARAGLAAGRAADPDARFMLEADTSFDGDPAGAEQWLDRIEQAQPGLLASADAVAAHPYSPRADISVGDITALRAALTHRGLKMPIWITEIGWSTCSGANDGCAGESEQASQLRTFLIAMARRGRADVAKVIVYDMRDLGQIASDREQHFGLLRYDGSPKPAWIVVRNFAIARDRADRAGGS